MNTSVEKDHRNGWVAQTSVDLSPDMVLTIKTCKGYRGGVDTTAKCYRRTETGFLSHTVCYGGGDPDHVADFSKVLLTNERRAAEPLVRVQHDAALVRFEAVKAEAMAYYQAREQCDAES